MSYSYYPGCSLHSTGLEYGLSTRAVFKHLGLELTELEDWNCCGASSAHVFDHELALALPARTLYQAQEFNRDLVIPCAACYNRLKGADNALRNDSAMRSELESTLGFKYTGAVAVRPVLAVLAEDVGVGRISAETNRPLHGLKVVTYYGCLLVRPPEIAQFDDPDNPQVMAELLRAVGAEVMPWSHATDCCGGSLSLSRSDVVQNLVGKLAERAREAGADAIATACPLCQVNLECYQKQVNREFGTDFNIPVLYFTQIVGLAFGISPKRLGIGTEFVSATPILNCARKAEEPVVSAK